MPQNPYPAAVSDDAPALELESMSANMLIAVPQMRDPFFSKTVVLLVEHNREGAYGVVLNRKAPVDLRTLLEGAGLPTDHVPEGKPVWWGGPVHPESGMVLYEDDGELTAYEPSMPVRGKLRVSWSMELLQDIAHGRGPEVYALYLGRSSWAPGQLDHEIAMGAWLPADADKALLFTPDTGSRWSDALTNIGVDPQYVAPGGPAEA